MSDALSSPKTKPKIKRHAIPMQVVTNGTLKAQYITQEGGMPIGARCQSKVEICRRCGLNFVSENRTPPSRAVIAIIGGRGSENGHLKAFFASVADLDVRNPF